MNIYTYGSVISILSSALLSWLFLCTFFWNLLYKAFFIFPNRIFALHLKPYPASWWKGAEEATTMATTTEAEARIAAATEYILYHLFLRTWMGLVSLHWQRVTYTQRIGLVCFHSVWFFGSVWFGSVGLGFWLGFSTLRSHFPYIFPSICIRISALSTGTRKWKMAIALALKQPIALLPPCFQHFPRSVYIGHCQF